MKVIPVFILLATLAGAVALLFEQPMLAAALWGFPVGYGARQAWCDLLETAGWQ